MTSQKPITAIGNWGTTNLVMRRLDGNQAVTGVGVSKTDTQGLFAVLQECCRALKINTMDECVLLSGMAGSNIGLQTAPYVNCGNALTDLSNHVQWHSDNGISYGLVPGAKYKDGTTVDVMRGEETETLGWMALTDNQSGVLCIPGTHTKWIKLQGGAIRSFNTALTGELFSVLSQHSILGSNPKAQLDEQAFRDGVNASCAASASLLHQLFQTRARQIDGTLSEQAASGFLSGLIIGHDINGARTDWAKADAVHIIAAPTLARPYRIALDMLAIENSITQSDDAAFAGLTHIAKQAEFTA